MGQALLTFFVGAAGGFCRWIRNLSIMSCTGGNWGMDAAGRQKIEKDAADIFCGACGLGQTIGAPICAED